MRTIVLFAAVLFASAPAALAQTAFDLSLSADETPGEKPWEAPAKVTWTSENGAESIAVDAALKASFAGPIPESVFSLFVVAHSNDKEKKLQEAYKAGVSLAYDFLLGDPIIRPGKEENPLALVTKGAVAFQRKAIYLTSPPPAPCTGNPALAFCDTQHEESLQTTFDIGLSGPDLEKAVHFSGKSPDGTPIPGDNPPPFLYGVFPTLTLFHDETVSAVVNPDTGAKADGGVTGVRFKLDTAVTPNWLDYRLTFKATFQQMEAFSRSDSRQSLFDKSTTLTTVSLDYNFVSGSFDKSKGWKPSIGISYTTGSDPLAGRADQEQTVVGFKLSYSPGYK